ncbi:MAG: YlxR family protein [Thermoleophilia bacterium]|nr:YlxR family protein [Thermoleophilia bacterium]
MKKQKKEPERQCIGCGLRGPQSEFVWLRVDKEVMPPRVVVVKNTRDRKGRGAYLCKRRVCLDRALQRKAFQRAFRMSVEVSVDEILEAIEAPTEG